MKESTKHYQFLNSKNTKNVTEKRCYKNYSCDNTGVRYSQFIPHTVSYRDETVWYGVDIAYRWSLVQLRHLETIQVLHNHLQAEKRSVNNDI